jgi:hypothetical protein
MSTTLRASTALYRDSFTIYVQLYILLAYFPSVAQVFIYPNLIVICVPSLADNFYAPWRYITHLSAIYILLHLRTNYMLTWIRLTNCSQS